MNVWPYKAAADNVLRALTELHVFIVITTALVLKNDLVMEVVTVDAYDWVLFISFICCVPGAFILAVIYKTGEMAAAVTKSASGVGSLPPAELRRRSFQLHVVGLGSDQDKERLRRFIDGWAVAKTHACFLSHFKEEAAAEARILKSELVRALKVTDDKVFLDADDLTDLGKLLPAVAASDVFVLMWTQGVLSRPWCLQELDAAVTNNVPILVLSVNNAFRADVAKVKEILADLPKYLAQANAGATKELEAKLLDPAHMGPTISKAIDNSKAKEELTFDPNQSSVMLQSQIAALASAMVDVACAENAALLPDLAPLKPEPWICARPVPIYIVCSEYDDQIQKQAAEVKAWLCRRADLQPAQVVVASDASGRKIDDAQAGDVDIIDDVDTVVLLQSKDLLSQPRCLARLYAANTNRAPIVTVHLAGVAGEWNFETAKSDLQNLDNTLAQAQASALTAACGAAPAAVGRVLSQVIPNVISKPLEIGGAPTQFEVSTAPVPLVADVALTSITLAWTRGLQAQMLDIHLTLRREMAAAGAEAVVAKQRVASPVRTRSQHEGVPPPPARTRSGGRSELAAQMVRSPSGRLRATARVVRAATPERRASERQPLAKADV